MGGFRSWSSISRQEVREQVGHLLHRDLVLEPLGHERLARALQLFDVGPQDRLDRAPRAAEGEARRALGRDSPGRDTAVLEDAEVLVRAGERPRGSGRGCAAAPPRPSGGGSSRARGRRRCPRRSGGGSSGRLASRPDGRVPHCPPGPGPGDSASQRRPWHSPSPGSATLRPGYGWKGPGSGAGVHGGPGGSPTGSASRRRSPIGVRGSTRSREQTIHDLGPDGGSGPAARRKQCSGDFRPAVSRESFDGRELHVLRRLRVQ